MKLQKFVFLPDIHWGYERDSHRHKVSLHDTKAWGATLKFVQDFEPNVVILGGDTLDCGAVSHHRRNKPGQVEGLRLLADAKECWKEVIEPLEEVEADEYIYLTGNHEDWLNDVVDEMPALEGILDVGSLLKLDKWEVKAQGEATTLGKLVFVHGDQLKGGDNIAKNATLAFERNVRFGHYHTYQVFTKTSALDMNGHTGVAVPCLCRKNPKYGQGAPNKWMQGFNWGYVDPKNGAFADYVSVIVNGRFFANGKEYVG